MIQLPFMALVIVVLAALFIGWGIGITFANFTNNDQGDNKKSGSSRNLPLKFPEEPLSNFDFHLDKDIILQTPPQSLPKIENEPIISPDELKILPKPPKFDLDKETRELKIKSKDK